MSAWRPYENFVAGELDNTKPGQVTGWLKFEGMQEVVKLELQGDFHRDIRGTVVKLHNDKPVAAAPEYMEGFANVQTGTVGDMTAGHEPRDYGTQPYFEWYSETNGRVVLELSHEQVQVIGTPKPWQQEEPVSREQQDKNMARWMTKMVEAVGAQFGFVASTAEEHQQNPETETKEEQPMATNYEKNYTSLMKLLGGKDYARIENGVGYMPLTVDQFEADLISVCHYGQHESGDLMRDPEVVFKVSANAARPVYFRNDFAGAEYSTIPERFGDVPVQPGQQKSLDRFTTMFLRNIREQGFFEMAEQLHAETAKREAQRAATSLKAEEAKPAATNQREQETTIHAADPAAITNERNDDMAEPTNDREQNGRKQPLARLSLNALSAAIWSNESHKGEYLTVTFQRTYRAKDAQGNDQFKTSHSFREQDLAALAQIIQHVQREMEQQRQQGNSQEQAQEHTVKVTR
jgi:hypothetical protein